MVVYGQDEEPMALIPTLNFQNIPAQEQTPNVLGRFLSAYRERGANEEERKSKMLQNMLLEKKIKGFDLNRLTGPAMEAQSLQRLLDNPNVNQETKSLAQQLFKSRLNSQSANTQNALLRASYMGFNALPASDKANLLALYRGAGANELEALGAVSGGVSPYQQALQKGLTPEEALNIDKQFAPTQTTITNIQDTQGALAEEHILGEEIDKGLSKFSRTLFGYSPKQVIGQFKNNKASIEEQADFLKARALSNEQAGIRARLANSSNAHQALKDLQAASLNDFKVFRGLIDPEVYSLAQKKIDKALEEMANARVYSMKGQKNPFSKALKESASKPQYSNLSTMDLDEKIRQLQMELQNGR